jgi:hypothetical protein
VKQLWKGKRPNADLKAIYVLAKKNLADQRPGMTEAEFVLGMHLIAERTRGAELPSSISEETWIQLELALSGEKAEPLPMPAMIPAAAAEPPPVHRERKLHESGWKLPPKDLVDSDPESDPEITGKDSARSTPGKPTETTDTESATPLSPPLSDRPPLISPHPLPLLPAAVSQPAPSTIAAVPDGEVPPPLPPREHVQLTGIDAWLTEHCMDVSIREHFQSSRLKLIDLWDVCEETLIAQGIARLQQRLAIYYGIWLSRKTLPPQKTKPG